MAITVLPKIKSHFSSSLFLNTYLIMIVRMITTGFGFLFWVLAARMLSSHDVGVASGIVSAAALLGSLGQVGLGYLVVRRLAEAEKPAGLLNASIVIAMGVGLLLGLLYLVGLPIWSPELMTLRASWSESLLFVIFVVATALSLFLNWAFLATRKLSFSVSKHAIQAGTAIVLLLLLSFVMPTHWAAVVAYLVATLVSASVALFGFLPKAQPGYRPSFSFAFPLNRPVITYSLVNFVTDQFQRMPDTILPLLIIQWFGPEFGAYFFVSWLIGRSVTTWVNSSAESLFAEGANDPSALLNNALQAAKMSVMMTLGLATVLTFVARFILAIYGPEYAREAAALLGYVAFSGVPVVLLSIIVSVLRVQDRLLPLLTILSASILLGFVGCYYGATWYGLTGVGMGWLVAQVAVLVGTVHWLWSLVAFDLVPIRSALFGSKTTEPKVA